MKREVESAGLAQVAHRLRSGERSLHAHLDELEARFADIEPSVRAFVPYEGRFERAHAQAEDLLQRFPDPASRPPLFGLTVGVKDIFHVDGFVTGAGVQPSTDLLQGPEAESVHRLRVSGALILGKTVTTEFGYFAPGPTRNPRNPNHTPGGSSSGSAAAVAAGLCDIGLGSQTIGSVIRPGAYCGVVGFKPSYGRISRVGFIPLAPSLDHVGFLVNDGAGARLVAAQLCYEWTDERVELKPVMGIPEGPYLEHAEPVAMHHFRRAVDHLRDRGFDIHSAQALEDFELMRKRHRLIVTGEAARVHARWFSAYVEHYHPTTLQLVREGETVSDDQLVNARDELLQARERMTRAMDEAGIDLWLTPAAPGPAPAGIDTTGDPVMNLPWSHLGLPAIGLPAGTDGAGLPLAVQLAGRFRAEESLFGWAIQVEAALATFDNPAPTPGQPQLAEREVPSP